MSVEAVSRTPEAGAPMSERERWLRNLFPFARKRDFRHPALKKADDERTLGERVADQIATFGGSWPFIFLFLGLIFGWILLNAVVLARLIHTHQIDPYPFIALNLILSALAGLQAPVILMSQNRAATRDEALAGQHYIEGQRTEQVISAMDTLLQQNTDLTRAVHDLTVKIHQVVGERTTRPD